MAYQNISRVFSGEPLKRFRHNKLKIVSLLVLLALFTSPFPISAGVQSNHAVLQRGTADWTFLVYLDADNDLELFGIRDFAEMAKIGSTATVNILVQFDRIGGYDSSNGNWTDTRRFRITQDMLPTAANGISIGEVNMGDPKTLQSFVNWGKANYPANNYAVILWDHGDGWRSASVRNEPTKSIAYDASQGDYLSSPELRSAMAYISGNGADKIDLLGYDACLMAMIEVDQQVIPYVEVRVGSEEVIPGDGWPYRTILSALVAKPSMTANQLGQIITERYYAAYGNRYQMSAVTLRGSYNSLLTNVDNFASALITYGSAYRSAITTARKNAQTFEDTDYIDLYDFAYEVRQRVNHSIIDTWATQVMSAIDAVVLLNRSGSGYGGAYGISIYFPMTEYTYDLLYDGSENYLVFTKASHWDEWLHAYFAAAPPQTPWLNQPENNLHTRDKTPTFSWEQSIGATRYQIQVDNHADFSSPAFTVTRTEASYTPSTALNDAAYYWRVRAGNATSWSAWSTVRTFTIDTLAPPSPTLLSPANGAETADHTPALQWKAVSTAPIYQLQVDNQADFSSPAMSVSRRITNYTSPTGLAAGWYYWRVRARDAAGNWSNWSAAWSFRITGATAGLVNERPGA